MTRQSPKCAASRDLRAELKRQVRRLESLGHRGSATSHESTAATLLATELTQLGLQPVTEPFVSYTSYGARLLLHLVVAAGGALMISISPLTALCLTLVALGSLGIESSTRAILLSRLIPSARSRNVVARVAATGPVVIQRIVLCAHLDTQRAGWIWETPQLRGIARCLTKAPGPFQSPLFLLSGVLGLQVIRSVYGCLSDGAGWFGLEWLLWRTYSAAAVLLGQWAIGPFVPGAVDNASGVAAAMELAKRWQSRRLEGIELVVLLTGSQEVGCLGAAAWLDAHADSLRSTPTCFLNLETLGYGRTRVLGGESGPGGLMLDYPSQWLRCAGQLGEQWGLRELGPHRLPRQTDGLAFLSRGFPGLTITTFGDEGSVPHRHQLSDCAEVIEFDVAVEATQFAWELLHELAIRCVLTRTAVDGGGELPGQAALDFAFADSFTGLR